MSGLNLSSTPGNTTAVRTSTHGGPLWTDGGGKRHTQDSVPTMSRKEHTSSHPQVVGWPCSILASPSHYPRPSCGVPRASVTQVDSPALTCILQPQTGVHQGVGSPSFPLTEVPWAQMPCLTYDAHHAPSPASQNLRCPGEPSRSPSTGPSVLWKQH